VLVVDGTFFAIPTIGILRGGSLCLCQNLIAVKLLKCFMANIAYLRRSCARLETAWMLVAPLADACGFLTMEQRVLTPL
jgi:hypothetical protein